MASQKETAAIDFSFWGFSWNLVRDPLQGKPEFRTRASSWNTRALAIRRWARKRKTSKWKIKDFNLGGCQWIMTGLWKSWALLPIYCRRPLEQYTTVWEYTSLLNCFCNDLGKVCCVSCWAEVASRRASPSLGNKPYQKVPSRICPTFVQPWLCNGTGKDPQKAQQTNSQLPEFLAFKKEKLLRCFATCTNYGGAFTNLLRSSGLPKRRLPKSGIQFFSLPVFTESQDLGGTLNFPKKKDLGFF